MPTTRKQKKARKCKGLEMLSDIENLDIKLGENHFNARDGDESLNSNLARRPKSAVSNDFEINEENTHMNPRGITSGISADIDHNSATANSSAEINRLSSELNSRLSREMDEMMNSVSVQIQRAMNDAISNQVLPQIQNAIKAGSGEMTKKVWDVPSERPELNPEGLRSEKAGNDLRSERTHGRQFNNHTDDRNAYDMVTGGNESPIQVPEFLTGRTLSRSHLNQSYDDINLDTTIPAPESIAPDVEPNPISRLEQVLTNMQNR